MRWKRRRRDDVVYAKQPAACGAHLEEQEAGAAESLKVSVGVDPLGLQHKGE